MTDINLSAAFSDGTDGTTIIDDLSQAYGFFQQGALQQAAAICEKVLRAAPGQPDACNLLAGISLQLGRPDEAVRLLTQAVFAEPTIPEYHRNLANALKALGRKDDAVIHFREALRLSPHALDICYDLAVTLAEIGRQDEAAAFFAVIVVVQPEVAEGYYRLGIGRLVVGDKRVAIDHFRRAVACQPDFTDAHTNLAIMRHADDRFELAMNSFRHAALLRPDDANIQFNYGSSLKEQGRFEEFSQILGHAIALAPALPEFHYSLAMVRSFKAGDRQMAALEKLAESEESFAPADQINLNFALAKAYEDVGDFARSFQRQSRGNALKRLGGAYDEPTALQVFERMKSVFDAPLLATTGGGNPSDLPIFVLGMPRSGSSLVEQILASHPQVFGAGELTEFPKMVYDWNREGGAIFPETIIGRAPDDFTGLGDRYLAQLQARAPEARRITDKMPDNFRMVGMIHKALPNAKIIHTKRDAVDTCLSIFSKLFNADMPFAYDLRELGRYWRAYDDLMTHWHRVLPAGTIFDLDYEALVADQEGQTRALLEHCGLPWDDACLQFHKTDRLVKTASSQQVKRPLYNSSVGRWRPDAELLAPLFAGLAGH